MHRVNAAFLDFLKRHEIKKPSVYINLPTTKMLDMTTP